MQDFHKRKNEHGREVMPEYRGALDVGKACDLASQLGLKSFRHARDERSYVRFGGDWYVWSLPRSKS